MVRPELLLETLTQSLLAGRVPGFSSDICDLTTALSSAPPVPSQLAAFRGESGKDWAAWGGPEPH
jgi:hypothetical protein